VQNPLSVLSTEQLQERRSAKWRKYDRDVLPVWVAEMDTPLAEPIATALTAAVARGDTGYAHPGRLAEAFAGFAQRRFGWAADPTRMVLVADVMSGIGEVLKLVSEPGAGVVINTPVYPPFFSFIAAAGRRVVESPLARSHDGYRLDLDRLGRDLARPDVSVCVLCNPHNPTGLVLRRDELAAVAELAGRHGVRLLVDEIHGPLTYPGVVHTPIATVPAEAADAAIAFVSASKAWNLAGLKAALAVAGGDAGWATLSALPFEASVGAGLLGVIAGEAAFAEGEAWLAALLDGLDANRRLLTELLARHLADVDYVPPDATYLAWLDLRRLGLGDDPAAALLEHGRVALASGPAFGDLGRGYARLNFATSPQRLGEALARMAAGVSNTARSVGDRSVLPGL
jgi:cystathionine beta-lyase